MAKELGMIHTINKTYNIPGASEAATPYLLAKLDVPGELTEQLQRIVRAGCYYKTVGIDISLGLDHDLDQSATIAGFIRYYAPTKGRCEAFRGAFKACADQMKIQGISMRDNPLYDFRVPLTQTAPAVGGPFPNQATLDGVSGLALNDSATDGLGVFQVHNSGVRPQYDGTATDAFSTGFRTLLDGGVTRTDFVLNDTVPYTGNHMIASTEYESIPFQLALSSDPDVDTTSTFQFRPDPALYIAVLSGQFEIVIEDLDVKSVIGLEVIPLNISVMVSGWKSIMGNPDKKKRSSKKRSRK
jgi:hypothetical protein